jgi:hypothetical protein
VTAILIVFIAALGALGSGLLLILEARRAPPGYEDDGGFHSGRTPGAAKEF